MSMIKNLRKIGHCRRFSSHVQKKKLEFAKKMRKHPTFAENLFWQSVRRKNMGVRFHRQSIILGWIVDFYCPALNLIIEIDGSSHKNKSAYDAYRDSVIKEKTGFTIIRVSNEEIFYNLKPFLNKIMELKC